jgi:hypothetical protein
MPLRRTRANQRVLPVGVAEDLFSKVVVEGTCLVPLPCEKRGNSSLIPKYQVPRNHHVANAEVTITTPPF